MAEHKSFASAEILARLAKPCWPCKAAARRWPHPVAPERMVLSSANVLSVSSARTNTSCSSLAALKTLSRSESAMRLWSVLMRSNPCHMLSTTMGRMVMMTSRVIRARRLCCHRRSILELPITPAGGGLLGSGVRVLLEFPLVRRLCLCAGRGD